MTDTIIIVFGEDYKKYLNKLVEEFIEKAEETNKRDIKGFLYHKRIILSDNIYNAVFLKGIEMNEVQKLLKELDKDDPIGIKLFNYNIMSGDTDDEQ